MQVVRPCRIAFVLFSVLSFVPAAMASDEGSTVTAQSAPETRTVVEAATPVAEETTADEVVVGAESWAVASEDVLAQERGGASVVVQRASSQAVVAGNEVGNETVTGDLVISDSAISDVNGVFSGTFNTGNNVSIQSNLNVTIEIQ